MLLVGVAIYYSNVLSIEEYYKVNPHAYGRPNHAKDEVAVRTHMKQVSEWWYNPHRPHGNDLYVGLAGTGPTVLIFYNHTYKMVNTVYYEPNLVAARRQAHKKKYTVPVAVFSIP